MKNAFYSFSVLVLLTAALIPFSNQKFPFLDGKYIYWLLIIAFFSIAFSFWKKSALLRINTYDLIVIALCFLGSIQLYFFSTATIYNITVWRYSGYILAYFLFRNIFTTTTVTSQILTLTFYFSASTSFINICLMFLQWKHLIDSSNEFFAVTGMFFSPNHLGVYLSLGCLSTIFLYQKSTMLWRKIVLSICGCLIFAGLCVSASRGAFIALFVALAYYLIGSKPKVTLNWKLFTGAGILLACSAYFLLSVNNSKMDSNSGRLFATRQIIKQIVAKPLGYGVSSFSSEYNKAKAKYFENNSNWSEMKNAGFIYNANNDFLELTYEFGVVWILIFIGFLFLLLFDKSTTVEVKMARTVIICLMIFAQTNTIVIIPILMLLAIICVVIIVNASSEKIIFETQNSRFLTAALSFVLIFIVCIRMNAEYKLCKLYEGKLYYKGETQLETYVSKIDHNGDQCFMAAAVLFNAQNFDKGIEFLTSAFERSAKTSLGSKLADVLCMQKKYPQAEAIYTYNKNVEPYRYEARMDLLHLYIESNQVEKGQKMAREILNLPVKIPSQKINRYKNEAENFLSKNGLNKQLDVNRL